MLQEGASLASLAHVHKVTVDEPAAEAVWRVVSPPSRAPSLIASPRADVPCPPFSVDDTGIQGGPSDAAPSQCPPAARSIGGPAPTRSSTSSKSTSTVRPEVTSCVQDVSS